MQIKPLVIRDLKAKIPIIQGGMGVGVSLSSLAGAVAAEGGVGIISTAQIGYDEPDWDKNPIEANLRAIERHIKMARKKALNGIIGVNIMVATRFYERYVKTAVKNGIDLIISGAGIPVELPAYVEGSNTKIAPIVSSAKSAMVILKMWDRKYSRCPDLVVIEGPLAGGHLGFQVESVQKVQNLDSQNEYINSETFTSYNEEIKKIMEIVKSYSEKYQYHIPVVIAGGIHTFDDVKHALEMGADGVQVATRFVTTKECDASLQYKMAYIQASHKDITIVKSPVGMPGRAILNSFIEKCDAGSKEYKSKKCHQCIEKCNPAQTPYCITTALVNAVKGDVDNGLIFCGAKAHRLKKIETVREVIKDLFPEFYFG